MTKFMETHYYNSVQDSSNLATKKEVMSILGTDEISELMKNEIDFIDNECNVKGSREIIELFKLITLKKSDEIISSKDIKLVGFDDEDQLILGVIKKDNQEEIAYTATGIYSFSTTFLDQLFCLGKFYNFCLQTGQKDLLRETIVYLLEKSQENEKQYRFINGKNEGEHYLRTITSSNRYKNYDNNIVLYLSLNAIHQYSKKMNNPSYIDYAKITDSSLDVRVMLTKTIALGKNYEVEIGIQVSNSEIREQSILFELIYTIKDKSGNKATAIGNKILDVTHAMRIDTVRSRLTRFDELDHSSKDFVKGIDIARLNTKLDEQKLHVIFDKLSRTRKNGLNSHAKREMDKIAEETAKNTYTLLELFNKLENIDTTIDEKKYLQMKFTDFLVNGFK
ncbi:hypothetical protein Q3F28_08380 [Enterococcus faecium]|uniref:hypothetical protein n=1 Tax=Enterococcus sp. ZQ21 TaxID=3044568 RepID=UPI0024B72311|nr:hypothetical protein [Enterococcus sp. ZQ21]MDQ8425288.1 hypothetical protein [Enterococcus faecium]WHP02860.1 hypothetical protein QK255_12525 [Enterococcus sp. ZQ21]